MFVSALVVLLAGSPGFGPATALERLGLAYVHKSEEEFGALLSSDYSFHTSDQKLVRFMSGWSRDHEIVSARGLFHGVRFGNGQTMPAADSLRIVMEGVVEGPDPEHPDSTAQYRMLAVKGYGITVFLPGGNELRTPASLHVFHLVRGDAAARVDGQTADSSRWYIRRWLENVGGVVAALSEGKGRCESPKPQPATPVTGEEGAASSAGLPIALAIHPLGNPACPALEIACDLPAAGSARIEVLDVMGRRVANREFKVAAPGTHQFEAGAGAGLKPGVYWVRLSQSALRPITRMVVVAR